MCRVSSDVKVGMWAGSINFNQFFAYFCLLFLLAALAFLFYLLLGVRSSRIAMHFPFLGANP